MQGVRSYVLGVNEELTGLLFRGRKGFSCKQRWSLLMFMELRDRSWGSVECYKGNELYMLKCELEIIDL